MKNIKPVEGEKRLRCVKCKCKNFKLFLNDKNDITRLACVKCGEVYPTAEGRKMIEDRIEELKVKNGLPKLPEKEGQERPPEAAGEGAALPEKSDPKAG